MTKEYYGLIPQKCQKAAKSRAGLDIPFTDPYVNAEDDEASQDQSFQDDDTDDALRHQMEMTSMTGQRMLITVAMDDKDQHSKSQIWLGYRVRARRLLQIRCIQAHMIQEMTRIFPEIPVISVFKINRVNN